MSNVDALRYAPTPPGRSPSDISSQCLQALRHGVSCCSSTFLIDKRTTKLHKKSRNVHCFLSFASFCPAYGGKKEWEKGQKSENRAAAKCFLPEEMPWRSLLLSLFLRGETDNACRCKPRCSLLYGSALSVVRQGARGCLTKCNVELNTVKYVKKTLLNVNFTLLLQRLSKDIGLTK